jgi:ribonuclease R
MKSAGKTSRKRGKEPRHARPLVAAISGPLSKTELQEIALETSEAERRAQEAERELIEWKKARFISDKVGDEFDALIISVTKYGFFVELIDLFVEGLVPADTLTDDRYSFREQQHQWVGERKKKKFRIGDRLRVRLDRAGEMGAKMSFSVVD